MNSLYFCLLFLFHICRTQGLLIAFYSKITPDSTRKMPPDLLLAKYKLSTLRYGERGHGAGLQRNSQQFSPVIALIILSSGLQGTHRHTNNLYERWQRNIQVWGKNFQPVIQFKLSPTVLVGMLIIAKIPVTPQPFSLSSLRIHWVYSSFS